MNPTVIIPWRESESRRRVFDWVLRYYRHRFDNIIISEHDDDGLFNKSKAINDGVKKANPSRDDLLVIADADCFVVDWAMRGGIERAKSTNKIVRPNKQYLRTTKEQAEFILTKDPTSEIRFHWFHRQFKKKSAMGGVWVLRFGPFADAGWMDEEFVGWGGEDSDMVRRMGSISTKGALWHLWHEPPAEKSLNSAGCKRFHKKHRVGRKRR